MTLRGLFTRQKRKLAALAAAATLALAACSPADSSSDSSDGTRLTFRVWDQEAAAAYRESFKEFHKKNPEIDVKVEVVSWNRYWDRLPLDISSGDMADVYWVNSSNYAQYADNGNLMDVKDAVGSDHEEWQKSVVDLYTRKGKLWGVPQLWDSIALYYNRDAVEAAGVDASNLTWAPDAGQGDTLLGAARKLTVDKSGRHPGEDGFDAKNVATYGFNAQADMQAVYLPFLAEAGGTYQASDGSFAFASPQGNNAFSYLVAMINAHRVAPPAADTNTNGDSTRDLFVKGRLALFQSGPYNLKEVADNAKGFKWGVAPMVAGPKGRISTVHGVAAVGNAKTKHKAATAKALKWLGSAEGQLPLAERGVSFPGAVAAQSAFVDYWRKRNVDVSAFVEASRGTTTKPPVGPSVNAGTKAYTPLLLDTFLGSYPVPEGLKKAQEAGNREMK